MRDLTEYFFTEIYPRYRDVAKSIKDDIILDQSLVGNVAILSVRGKENVRSISKLISSNGFKPTVFEFEEVLRSKGRVQKKLQNTNLLISHAKDTPVHLFAGSENYHYEKFLGKDGLLFRTKFSNLKVTPQEMLRMLFLYMQTSGDLNTHFQHNENSKPINTLSIPVDIKETLEFKEILDKYNFEQGITDIRPVTTRQKKSLCSLIKSRKKSSKVQTIKFTFTSKNKLNKQQLKSLESELNEIFSTYKRNDFRANVQTVFEDTLIGSAA